MVIHPKRQLRVLLSKQRKASPMDHGPLRMSADKFQGVFSASLLTACGQAGRLWRRQRVRTPLRVGLALTATCASQRAETIAAVPCSFHALFGTTVPYQAFDNPVAKPQLAEWARTMPERLSRAMPLQGLGGKKGCALAAWRRILMQDGNSLAMHDGVREVLPGRLTVVRPAAVALHTPMDLRCAAPTTVVDVSTLFRTPNLTGL